MTSSGQKETLPCPVVGSREGPFHWEATCPSNVPGVMGISLERMPSQHLSKSQNRSHPLLRPYALKSFKVSSYFFRVVLVPSIMAWPFGLYRMPVLKSNRALIVEGLECSTR